VTGIFKAYDIRGIYPQEIDETVARKIGFAFAQYLDKQRIVIGRDMRESAETLAQAFAEGVLAYGTSVTDIGMTTTPMLYYAIIEGRFDGGAMVSASHLPAGYNGIKLCREQAIPLSGNNGLPDVEEITKQTSSVPASSRGTLRRHDYLEPYLQKLAGYLECQTPMRIVVDAGNGMGGLDVPRFFERFPGYSFVPMYMQPDGEFPHHVPNPALPENTRELQQRVISEKADLGVAFDGDGDRCGFVDEQGQRIEADLALAALAAFFLHREPGATILYDLRASHAVPEYVKSLGGKPLRTRVGHSFIKRRMREVNAVFAGELSGHFYFQEMGYIDCGIMAMITMLNLLALKRVPVSSIIRPLRKYARSGELSFQIKDAGKLLRALAATYADGQQDNLDGLTVVYPHWWFNLRQSHTESVVRLVVEADDARTLEREEGRLVSMIQE
jgi:phosphomannomutase